MLKLPLLSILIGLSFTGGIILLLTDKFFSNHSIWKYRLALMITIGCCVVASMIYAQFDYTNPSLQFQENHPWIERWGIRYALGVDGLSLSLIILTVLINLVVILSAWNNPYPQSGQYLGYFFLTQALFIGSFAATNAMFFYICWEALLLPMLLNIGRWGSQQRSYASIKFFLYTFLGSSGLLIAILYLGNLQGSVNFNIQDFYGLKLSYIEQIYIFLGLFIGFTIKVPLWPLHTWLPDAHSEAPTEGSMILAALMLKLGGYGLLRFCLPIAPVAIQQLAPWICYLSIISIISAGMIAFAQSDIKRLIAYSSISHMGMVVLGVFVIFLKPIPTHPNEISFLQLAIEGATFQMIAHALSTTGLFLVTGILYKRFRSRQIADYRGMATVMPILAAFFLVCILSTVGLPGTAGFVGEFLIILGAVYNHWGIGLLTSITLILSAGYMLLLYKQTMWGTTYHSDIHTTSMQLHISEKLALLIISASILGLGIYPNLCLMLLRPSLQNILQLSLLT